MKSIKQWQEEIHENAINHGWYDENRPILELLCLIHSEVSEALEAYRKRDYGNFKEEMADIVIRVFDMAEYLDIDIETEMDKKHEINKNRSYKHGNKRC
jgi:NTP pyrophosphatase (non-canonical NTP hydrolase)